LPQLFIHRIFFYSDKVLDQSKLIYLNIAFFIIVALYFWRGRARDKTTVLNLGGKTKIGPNAINHALRNQGPQHQSERDLGVIFNFNGHQWEAYQVLGVPAGSSIETCRHACQKLQQSDDSKMFELALQAILAATSKNKLQN
jgi:hypothetical protein